MGKEHEANDETDLLLLCPASGGCCCLPVKTRRAGGRLSEEQAQECVCADLNNGFLWRVSTGVDFLTVFHLLCLLIATVSWFYLLQFQFWLHLSHPLWNRWKQNPFPAEYIDFLWWQYWLVAAVGHTVTLLAAGMEREGSWALTGSLNWKSLCTANISATFQNS